MGLLRSLLESKESLLFLMIILVIASVTLLGLHYNARPTRIYIEVPDFKPWAPGELDLIKNNTTIVEISLNDLYEAVENMLVEVFWENVSSGDEPYFSPRGDKALDSALAEVISSSASEVSPRAYYEILPYYEAVELIYKKLIKTYNFTEYFLFLPNGSVLILRVPVYPVDYEEVSIINYPPIIEDLKLDILNLSAEEFLVGNKTLYYYDENGSKTIIEEYYYGLRNSLTVGVSLRAPLGEGNKHALYNDGYSSKYFYMGNKDYLNFTTRFYGTTIRPGHVIRWFSKISIADKVELLGKTYDRESNATISVSLVYSHYDIKEEREVLGNVTVIKRYYYPSGAEIEVKCYYKREYSTLILNAMEEFLRLNRSKEFLENLTMFSMARIIRNISRSDLEYALLIAQIMYQVSDGSTTNPWDVLVNKHGKGALLAAYLCSLELPTFINDNYTFFVILKDEYSREFILSNNISHALLDSGDIAITFDSRSESMPASFFLFIGGNQIQASLYPRPLYMDGRLMYRSDLGPDIIFFKSYPLPRSVLSWEVIKKTVIYYLFS